MKSLFFVLFCSINGLLELLKERAFKQELFLGLICLILVIVVKLPLTDCLYIFSSYFLVLIAEAFNTAIETVVNRISLEKHLLSKKAKDVASSAVMIPIIHFFIVLIFCILKNSF